MLMDATRDFILCQIEETLETNEILDLSSLQHRIMLYNSLVALIILPVEEMKKRGTKGETNPLYSTSLSNLRKQCHFSLELFEPIERISSSKGEVKFNRKNLYAFMRKLRNAIAHQNVRFIEQDGTASIVLFNIYPQSAKQAKVVADQLEKRGLTPKGNGVEDFRIKMTFEELRTLGNWIGSEYLRALQFSTASRREQ